MPSDAPTVRMLFTGYAPVHFICFQPLYRRLAAHPGVEVFLSGGTRAKNDAGEWEYDAADLYRTFDVPAERVLSVEEIRERDFDVLFSAHTKLIAPRSVGRRIQIFHGISFRNKSVRPENMSCDHYFMVGPYQFGKFREAGLMEEGDPRAVPVGFMKTDALFGPGFDREALLARFGFTGERPVVLYAPTGAKKNSLETVGEEVIGRIIESDRYDLLVKLHDHPKNKIDWGERLARFPGPRFHVEKEADVVPMLRLADLLITDASSVCNEYALLDRPMVFVDTPKLLAKAGAAENSALDLNTWGRRGGAVVEDPAGIVAAIDHGLAHPEEKSEIRRAMAKDFFYNPGHATDAAMQWLEANVLAPVPCA